MIYVESDLKIREQLMAARGKGCGEMGKMGEREWKIQASSCGMNKLQE